MHDTNNKEKFAKEHLDLIELAGMAIETELQQVVNSSSCWNWKNLRMKDADEVPRLWWKNIIEKNAKLIILERNGKRPGAVSDEMRLNKTRLHENLTGHETAWPSLRI